MNPLLEDNTIPPSQFQSNDYKSLEVSYRTSSFINKDYIPEINYDSDQYNSNIEVPYYSRYYRYVFNITLIIRTQTMRTFIMQIEDENHKRFIQKYSRIKQCNNGIFKYTLAFACIGFVKLVSKDKLRLLDEIPDFNFNIPNRRSVTTNLVLKEIYKFLHINETQFNMLYEINFCINNGLRNSSFVLTYNQV